MTTNALALNLPAPSSGLEGYVQAVNSIPVLSAEEEVELAQQYRQHQDIQSAQRLVLSHLRFVVQIARGYKGYGLAQADLIQEGNIGLMKAVKRFDPDKGVRLVSFAVHWVKAEMHEFILRNWRIVKVATTKSQRKLFFNLRRKKSRLGWFNKEEMEAVAKDLGVSVKDVEQMEARLSYQDNAFDGYEDDDGEAAQYVPANYLKSSLPSPEQSLVESDSQQHNLDSLHQALAELDDRSRDIVSQRWLSDDKSTLHELAAKYQISAERVRQLENNAMKKLRSQMLEA